MPSDALRMDTFSTPILNVGMFHYHNIRKNLKITPKPNAPDINIILADTHFSGEILCAHENMKLQRS